MRQQALIISTLFLYAAATACGGKNGGDSKLGSGAAGADTADRGLKFTPLEDAAPGLDVRLSEGRQGPRAGGGAQVTAGEALSPAATKRLLARLPALAVDPTARKKFAFRAKSQPPPRTGKTVELAFPGPGKSATPPPEKGDLRVVRFAPEGAVPIAPHVSITFSQAMTAITSQAQSVAGGVPAELSPTPAGKWRWLGTKTLLFDPDVRMPMATRYRVRVPASAASVTGARMAKDVEFTFETPPVTVVSSYPQHGPHKLDPVIFIRFDQRIDADKFLGHVELSGGGKSHQLRHATEAEIQADDSAYSMYKAAREASQERRVLALRPVKKLPAGTSFTLTVKRGAPSAEGPLTTQGDQTFSFRTYDPLRITDHYCSWRQKCPPGSPWVIEFNNPIDDETFDPASISFEPELPGVRVQNYGRTLYITGRSKGRTTYRVQLSEETPDIFGQRLGSTKPLTFTTGDANPRLNGPGPVTVVDPAARKKPTFDFHSINIPRVRVTVHRVTPGDWDAYLLATENNPRVPRPLPGKRVMSREMRVEDNRDRLVETKIDLSAAFGKNRLGHAVILVEPTSWPDRWKPRLLSWVQSTEIGLDAFVDGEDMYAWATELADGKPAKNINFELVPFGVKAAADASGMATLALKTASGKKKRSHMLLARRGQDSAILAEGYNWWSIEYGGWFVQPKPTSLRWFVFDDRRMYKPGEEVHFKGWLRRHTAGKRGKLAPLGASVTAVNYRVTGPRGNELLKGSTKVSKLGGFDGKFELPKTPNLGWASLELTAVGPGQEAGRTSYHRFQIQEFRTPEFEVTTTPSPGPYTVGAGADITAKGAYYAGGVLPGAPVQWHVNSTATNFTPPNRSDYTFGVWTPWWMYWNDPSAVRSKPKTLAGETGADGTHVLHLDFLSAKPARPMSVVAAATITDVNRQAWGSNATLLVHPSSVYVGLKRERLFLERGKPIEIEALVVDHDGKEVAGRKVSMRAVRLAGKWKRGKYIEEELDPQTCEHVSTTSNQECSFETKEGGLYRISATVFDKHERPSETQLLTWVSGGELPPQRGVSQEQLTLVPDKKEYAPGETASIMVQSPFYPAEGLLTLRRSGIVKTTRFEMSGPSKTLSIPIDAGHVPNVWVNVDVVGVAARTDDDGEPLPKAPKRPAFATASMNLEVPAAQKRLKVTAKPAKAQLAPGQNTKVSVTVTDAGGKPVPNAEVTVVVVDEAILGLSGYTTPDPLPAFYPPHGPNTRDYHSRALVRLANPIGLTQSEAKNDSADMPREEAEASSLRGLEADGAPPPPASPEPVAARKKEKRRSRTRAQAQEPAIAVRTNFNALAVFAPEQKTDRNGKATVAVKLPDNLTRYRIMAVAVAGHELYGSGESNLRVRLPLMVRPSPPRFLNFGDTFELPIVLQNQTDEAMTVEVAVRADNAALTQGDGRKVTVAAQNRVEVRFPAAAGLAGTARFQVGVSAGGFSDAAQFSLPVWTPATAEAFATYGEIDEGAVRQRIEVPGDAVEEYGGVEITTSSTQLQALTDAFLYLVRYPYECAEQTSSRVLAVAALRDVLTEFDAEGLPAPAEIEEAVARDIKRLKNLQNRDGGFAFWVRGHESWPYISIHAAHALVRARDRGYKVPQPTLDRSKNYLREIERHIPSYYPLRVRRTLIAYALWVRHLMGDPDPARARRLLQTAGTKKLSMEAIGWLLGSLAADRGSKTQVATILRYLDNQATETAATATWSTSYSDGAHLILHSSRRADAVVLESLITARPKSDLIAKVTRGLLAHRKRGRWLNTQENAFVLLAMHRYFQTYEKNSPAFVAKAWLGDDLALEQRYRGRQTTRHHLGIPMDVLASRGTSQALTLAKTGRGRLYYRVGMNYAPRDLKLAPADYGFAVERTYEAVDDPADVTRNPDGSWTIRAGALVRVRLQMAAQARRYHVALVDPLPAGLEPLNPELKVTGTIPTDPNAQKSNRFWWWSRPWYEHQNMRDERVEAFASIVWAGVHDYSYVARATTPGRFVAPPARAEEMYHPETFGRSGTDRVNVK